MATCDEEFIKQLREVFDLCDELKCGFISVSQLRDIVRQHFGGSEQEVAELIECLDPNQHGVVTFADFCRGVESTLRNSAHRQPCLIVNGGKLALGDTDSAIATGSDVSRESLTTGDKPDSDSENGEEKFCFLLKSTEMDSWDRSPSRSPQHRRRRCSRPINRLTSKRLSTSALANQLHRSGSRRNSQSSDDVDLPMSIEDDVIDLNQKVQELQQQVSALTDNQLTTDQRYNKVKQENAQLHNKIHSLEEQLRELEVRSDDRLETDQHKIKEIMARCERESKLEVEQYATKLFSVQKEMTEEAIRLKTQVDKLKQDKADLCAQLSECSQELLNLREEHLRLQEGMRREREDFNTERNNANRLLEELTCELEKCSAPVTDVRLRSTSMLELPAQYKELQQELRIIRDENKLILETNEELSAQLLANSLQEGRTLVNQPLSLADEFDTLTKDEMMVALHDQKEVNAKLKSYIDGILLNILENHPQLLEVKNNF